MMIYKWYLLTLVWCSISFDVCQVDNNLKEKLINKKWKWIDSYSFAYNYNDSLLIEKDELSKSKSRNLHIMQRKPKQIFYYIPNDKTKGVHYLKFEGDGTMLKFQDAVQVCSKKKWVLQEDRINIIEDNFRRETYKDSHVGVDQLCDEFVPFQNSYIARINENELVLIKYRKKIPVGENGHFGTINVFVSEDAYDERNRDFDKDEFYIVPIIKSFLNKKGSKIRIE